MQFTNYWQQFEHTGRVEDYLNYLRSTERDRSFPMRAVAAPQWTAGRKDVQTCTAREDGSCRNPCM